MTLIIYYKYNLSKKKNKLADYTLLEFYVKRRNRAAGDSVAS